MSNASGARRCRTMRDGWHWVWADRAPLFGFIGCTGWLFDGETLRIRFVRLDQVTDRRST